MVVVVLAATFGRAIAAVASVFFVNRGAMAFHTGGP
jgi:hypothetical protein